MVGGPAVGCVAWIEPSRMASVEGVARRVGITRVVKVVAVTSVEEAAKNCSLSVGMIATRGNAARSWAVQLGRPCVVVVKSLEKASVKIGGRTPTMG